ncbi:MAG: hypothetical protein WD379_08855 [Dehalococcoidia bacterium]
MTDTDYAIAYKLTRATTHLKALHRTIERFLKGKANGVVNDFTSEPGYLIVRAFSHSEPPPSCSGLIGETLYHQRAALDYMACDLARYNEQVVDDHVEFPIFLERDKFRNPVTGNLTGAVEKRIRLLRPDHQAVIEDEQPFQGRHGRPEDDPLWLLYRLSNFDRHQFIHLTSVITNASFHNFTPSEAAARFEQVSVTYGTFESQAEVARFRILPGPELDVYAQSDVRFDVAFYDKGLGAGRPVLQTLGGIGVRVAEIMQRFTPLV